MSLGRGEQVFLAGRGLACALGLDLPSALLALRRGGVPACRVRASDELEWPFHAIADQSESDWLERAQRLIVRVVRESGAQVDRRGPLFLASSSLDVGAREQGQGTDAGFLALAEHVARWLDWRGPVFTVSTACTSAVNATLSAAALLRAGEADEALVLGVEMGNRLSLAGFSAMQLLAPASAQPFGAARQGLVLGEAVAALRLSRWPARWRVAGGANVVDGRDPAGATGDAVAAMCLRALEASGLQAADLGLIKLQAAGSPGNDAVELAGLRQVFERLPPLVSFKAALGHTLGASGAAELALLTACIDSGAWPRFDYPLDTSLHVALAAEAPASARYVLAAILGFGGGHAAVVLEDCGLEVAP